MGFRIPPPQCRSGLAGIGADVAPKIAVLILIEDLGLQLPMPFKRSTLGEQVLVKVSHVDPRKT